MIHRRILIWVLLAAGGCNPIEDALEYDWSREAPVEERMIVIETNRTDPQVQFAVREILKALQDERYPAKILLDGERSKYRQNAHISIGIDASAGLRPQGYSLSASINDKGNPQFIVSAGDAAGAMYGGLHLAEAVRIEKTLSDIRDARQEPFIEQRGLKISIPTEARTSGSAGAGDSEIRNSAEMGKVDFWTEFLDTMACYRFNVLMLRADGGPEAMRAAFRKNTDLWSRVMQHAKDRGIRIYLLAADSYRTDADAEPSLQDSMRQWMQTYPDLAGLGVAAGQDAGSAGRILEARRESPQPDALDWTFRYVCARLYSSPTPTFHTELLETLRSKALKCWWDLDNGDIFVHRWGDPDYVRQFLMNFPLDQTAGYFVGSDGCLLGREFISIDYTKTRPLEIVKHWYSFMLWGRLGYNPNLDRAFFEKLLQDKFPTANPALLYEAWQASSKIIPLVNRFHWRHRDTQWYAEGCMGSEGFHTVKDFVNPAWGTMPGSGMISIPNAVADLTQGRAVPGTGPLQVADQLDGLADEAMETSGGIKLDSVLQAELAQTLDDIEAMAWLGKYYAAKIRGAFDYAMAKASGQAPLQQSAVRHLTTAADYWRNYARKDTSRYKTQVLARTGKLDWWEIWEQVKQEADTVRKE